ncbi:MAG: hypothetical protein K6A41_00025, partial [Bacteroidales bacterium]|nr:hypothetical protein [Bacteroidales bacterium]
ADGVLRSPAVCRQQPGGGCDDGRERPEHVRGGGDHQPQRGYEPAAAHGRLQHLHRRGKLHSVPQPV